MADDYPTFDRAQRLEVVRYARDQIGKDYRWLGSGPDAYDCSGLIQQAWAQAGFEFPGHQVADQIRYIRGSRSPLTNTNYERHGHVHPNEPKYRKQLQLGDLVFVYGDVDEPDSVTHGGIVSGWQTINGQRQRLMVAAVSTQYGVLETTISWGGKPSGFGLIGH